MAEAQARSQGQAELFHFRQGGNPESPPNVTALFQDEETGLEE